MDFRSFFLSKESAGTYFFRRHASLNLHLIARETGGMTISIPT
jgi:hypothetical protein